MSRLDQALAFAKERHAGQFRADGVTPYFEHPNAVVEILKRAGIPDEDVLCAGALHDVVEDKRAKSPEIRQAFGERVATLVFELTNASSAHGLLQNRQDVLVDRFVRMTDSAKLVKMADRICNCVDATLSPPPTWSAAKCREYFIAGLRMSEYGRAVHEPLAIMLYEVALKGLDAVGWRAGA
jgi:guanosine-3',5'-bis(diphosphate) 3'-pyrophosphohydrolase